MDHAPSPVPRRLHLAAVGAASGAALAMSCFGLYDAASTSKMSLPALMPVVVDGFGLSLTLAIWRRHAVGRRAVKAWVLLVVVTAVSSVIQIAAAGDSLRDRAMHGSIPWFVLAAFEQLVSAINAERSPVAPVKVTARPVTKKVRPAAVTAPERSPVRVAGAVAGERSPVKPQVTAVTDGDRSPDLTAERPVKPPADDLAPVRRAVAELEAKSLAVTGPSVAKALGVSPKTGQRRLTALALADRSSGHADTAEVGS